MERAIVKLIRRVERRNKIQRTSLCADRDNLIAPRVCEIRKRSLAPRRARERERRVTVPRLISECLLSSYSRGKRESWIVKRRSMAIVKRALEFLTFRDSRALPNAMLDGSKQSCLSLSRVLFESRINGRSIWFIADKQAARIIAKARAQN